MIPQFSILPATGRALALAFAMIWLASDQRCISRASAQATMTIDIVDEKSGEPIPCRIELKDATGRALKTRGGMNHLPWSIVNGQFVFKGRAGDYRFDVFHGPEYASGGGGFTLDKDGEGGDSVRLPRYADMLKEGWLGGDLLALIPKAEVRPWLAAEGLMMASIVQNNVPAVSSTEAPTAAPTELNKAISGADLLDNDRWSNYGSYYDDRRGSGLVLHHWMPPAPVPEAVPSARLLVMAKQQPETHAEIARLWARDVPVWLASGRIDSIQLLSEQTTRDGKTPVKLDDMFHTEPARYKGARGVGRLVENIYWQVLEAGLRIPPSAGSAVGKSSSPLGYNRVYVALGGQSERAAAGNRLDEQWWEALRAGRSFVTNGPLLRAKVNGELPGRVFALNSGTKLSINVSLDLTVADPVDYVDVVFNGEALYHAKLDEYAKQGGKIPLLEISESGWLVVRVVTGREETYRLASTAPFYFEVDGKPRIERTACQFFVKWLEKTIAEQKRQATPEAATRAAEPYQSAALEFWRKRLNEATVDVSAPRS